MSKIIVVGSSNTDFVIHSKRFPKPGETLLGGASYMFPGGKGANQAVAAVRFKATVIFVAALGNDVFGQKAIEDYKKEGIITDNISVFEGQSSGMAMININGKGQNTILVASGANTLLNSTVVKKAFEEHADTDLILTQLETPVETIEFLAKECRRLTKRLILNPAPYQLLPDEIYDGLFLITPNETEASALTNMPVDTMEDYLKIGEMLLDKGIQNVIITLGSKGAFFMNREIHFLVEAPKVSAVDTTAAGDVFNGVLAVSIAEGKSFQESISRAVKAAAFSVTRMGAQNSAPYINEI